MIISPDPSHSIGGLMPVSNVKSRPQCPSLTLPTPYSMRFSIRKSWRCLRVDLCALFTPFLILTTAFLTCIDASTGIIAEFQPISVVESDALLSQSFHGNQSHVDYFRLLQRDGDSLLIGARDYVYNISIYDLSEHIDRRIEWVSRPVDSQVCFSKGKSEAECHNYIRVLAKKDEGKFLVCGTNAYKPICRDYNLETDGNFTFVESSGVGKCPYNPQHNSTFVFADGELYAGTVVDFQGMIPLVFRDPLKTDHNDYRQLNAPDFVHSFEYADYVFFFFREAAVEYMNCGKRVYSRVARVCKGDKGAQQGSFGAMSTWTTFIKSRLNCSFPGEFPFYFDEIQSVSDVVLGRYGSSNNEVIYAIFTTPQNSIPGSAVCSFSMRDVLDTFEGPFKEQKDLNSNWLPVPQHQVPDPRPGSCVNDSQTLPQESINFVRSHPLMEELVPPFLGQPILMKASFQYRFTKLTVDPQVPLLTGGYADVLFIATDVGMILKVINNPVEENERQANPIIIEEIHVFDHPVSINNLQITKEANGESKLIMITEVEVKAIPLARCTRAESCSECIALQDPYCGWYPNLGVCENIAKLNSDIVLQNVSSGIHQHCPSNVENNLIQNPSTQIYTTEPSVSPTPEVETSTPCVCADQPTPISSPQNPSSPKPSPNEGSAFDSSTNVVVSENEIDPLTRSAPPHTEDISNYIPVVSHSSRSRPIYPTQAVRAGKELPPARGLPRELNEVSIAYSEGVTGPVVGASMDGPLIYSAETLAIAVTTACVAALVVGFISGFLFSRKCRGDDYPHFSDTPYLDSKLNKCENTADPNMYTANNASLPPGKQINNLVATNLKNTNNGKSNTNTSADRKLVKPAKCAYI